MKRAKEYAKELLQNQDPEKIGSVGKEFLLEIKELMDLRKAQSDEDILAIFKEQQDKWEAVCRRVDWLPKDGFLNMASHLFKDAPLVAIWVEIKRSKLLKD